MTGIASTEDHLSSSLNSMAISDNGPVSASATSIAAKEDDTDPTTSLDDSIDETSLYVGDLDLHTTEEQLGDLFSTFGEIKDIQLARNSISKRPLGYAFIHFVDKSSAQEALKNAADLQLYQRPLKIQPFVRNRLQRKESQKSNIFIKNIDPSIDSDALFETFSAFGTVLSCKVATDDFGVSKGFAYVLYDKKESADAAVEKMNGVLMNDRRIWVCFHVSRQDRLSKIEELKANYTNLYVKSIDASVTEDEFKDLFEKYGTILSYSLPLDPESGLSRGFGFVNFQTHDSATQAVEALDGYELKGKKLYVSRAQKKIEREEVLRQQNELARLDKLPKFQGVNLYIKFLDASIGDEELKNIFSPYGKIVSAKVMTDEKGKSRCFGFVCYSSPDEAQKAISSLNEAEIKGHRLYVAIAQRKETAPPGGSPLNRGLYHSGGFNGRQGSLYPGAPNPAAAFAAFAAYAAAAAAATQFPPGMMAQSAASNPFPFMPMQYNGAPSAYQQYIKSPVSSPQLNSQGFSTPVMEGAVTPSSQMSSSPRGSPAPADPSTPSFNGDASSARVHTPSSARNASTSNMNPYMSPAFYFPGSPYFASPGNNQASWAASSQALMAAASNPRLLGSGYRQRQASGKRTGSSGPNGKKASSQGNGYVRYSKSNKEPVGGSSLSAAVASAANPEAEKQVIGEAIYRKVVNHELLAKNSDAAAKVTGMLLEQDKEDLLRWIDDDETLNEMIQVAHNAYMEFLNQTKQQD